MKQASEKSSIRSLCTHFKIPLLILHLVKPNRSGVRQANLKAFSPRTCSNLFQTRQFFRTQLISQRRKNKDLSDNILTVIQSTSGAADSQGSQADLKWLANKENKSPQCSGNYKSSHGLSVGVDFYTEGKWVFKYHKYKYYII